MFHGHLNYFQKPSLGGRPNTNPGDHGTPNAHNHSFILFYHVWRPTWTIVHWNNIGWGPGHIRLHTTLESPWPHYMILGVCWGGLWTLSFGLSQFHGHGSWLVWEVALSFLACPLECFCAVTTQDCTHLSPQATRLRVWPSFFLF